MHQRTKLPISDILVEDRQREDYGNIEELADSLRRLGLIQPIVVTHANRLIAGGRRLAAAQLAGWTEIDVVYRETLSEDELYELELEENVRRKDMSWQEKAKTIYKIHQLKIKIKGKDGEAWGQKETGELLNMTQAHVSYALQVARELIAKPDGELAGCDGLRGALDLLARRRENELLAELSKRTISVPPTNGTLSQGAIVPIPTLPPPLAVIETGTTEGGVSDSPMPAAPVPPAADFIVPVSFMLRHGDCLEVMKTLDPVDHIITDPPYAIDMDMLQQENTGMDVSSTRNEHQVEENLDLLTSFIPLAREKIKPNGFLVMWCDMTRWESLRKIAEAWGFKTQRWPLVWHKTHTCMNQAANFNFTKNYEVALVCRKEGATLASPSSTSIFQFAKGDMYRGYHPFFKPFDLWQWVFDHVCIQGQTVLDPFMGEGSSILAAIGSGLRPIGIEKVEQHYLNAVENVKRRYLMTNKNAKFV